MGYAGIVVAGIAGGLLAGGLLYAPPAGAVAPLNNDLAGATSMSALPYSNIVDTIDANRQSGEPLCDLISATVGYKHTPVSNVTLSAGTAGSDFDTVLAVFRGPASSPTFGSLSLVGCNDQASGDQSQVVFAAAAGTTYYFQVGGVAGGTGNLTFSLGVSAVAPPANYTSLAPLARHQCRHPTTTAGPLRAQRWRRANNARAVTRSGDRPVQAHAHLCGHPHD